MDDSGGLDDGTIPDSALMGDPMDDLFGDGADGLGVALPPIPLPAPLVSRVAELQRSGCCTRLYWSNIGSIAHITRDGSRVVFRAMQRHPKSGKWTISEAVRPPVTAPEGRRFVHVEISRFGLDMAVVDNVGGIHMYTTVSTLSRLQPSPVEVSSRTLTDVDALVCLHWLPMYPQELRAPYITKVVKAGDRWISAVRSPDPSGAKMYHPAEGRSALLYVTRGSRLTLLYQNESNSWLSVSTELEAFDSTQQFLTHAAIGDNGDHLILATHDETSQLRVYSIVLNWNAQSQQRNGVNVTVVAPAIDVSHLTALDSVAPQMSDLALLSHLKILTPCTENQGNCVPLTLTIFAVFIHVVSPVNTSQQLQDSFSAVARWQVDKQSPAIHESFAKLKKNGDVPQQNPTTRLNRLPDIITNKTVLTIDNQYRNTIIALGASDGTVDFRDASTLDNLGLTFGRTEEVSNLPDAGFEHLPTDHHPLIALSADGSFVACARPDDQVDATPMTLRYGWETVDDGISDGKATVEAAIVCLARQYAFFCYASQANDDALALLPTDLPREMCDLFFREIIRMTSARPDLAMLEPQKQQLIALRDPFIHRALSSQLILGLKPGTVERQYPAQFAYLALNLKLSATVMIQSLSNKSAENARPDIPPSLVGVAKWATDVMIYIVDNLMQVKQEIKDGLASRQAFEEYVNRTQSPAVHLLLSGFSRTLLKCIAIYVQNFFRIAQGTIPRVQSVADRQQLYSLVETAKAMPFSFQAFHELLSEVDNSVRETYTPLGNTPDAAERRTNIEASLMISPSIANELAPVIQSLVDRSLPKLAANTDLSKLTFYDTSWLQIRRNTPRDHERKYDTLRKIPLVSGMKLRYCRRCGAEMEDLTPDQLRRLPPGIAQAQRHCYCFSYWWTS